MKFLVKSNLIVKILLFLIGQFGYLMTQSEQAKIIKEPFVAYYTFSQLENQSSISSLLLNTISYELFGCSNTTYLTGKISGSSGDNITVTQTGSSDAIFCLKKNLVKFNDKPSDLYFFEDVSIENQKITYDLNGYKSELYTSIRGDSLYLSKGLPFYVNPLLLNSNSIPYGIVMAKIKNLGKFELQTFKKVSGKNCQQNLWDKDYSIIKSKNIFF